jgi:hypothetical protein
MKKIYEKITILALRISGRGDALVQYQAHHRIKGVQGYKKATGCPLGEYSGQYMKLFMHAAFFPEFFHHRPAEKG